MTLDFGVVKMTENNQETKTEFSITKKIARHGSQAIIIIPKILETQLKPGTIVELKINVIDGDTGE